MFKKVIKRFFWRVKRSKGLDFMNRIYYVRVTFWDDIKKRDFDLPVR